MMWSAATWKSGSGAVSTSSSVRSWLSVHDRRVEVEEVVRVDGALRPRGGAGRVLDEARARRAAGTATRASSAGPRASRPSARRRRRGSRPAAGPSPTTTTSAHARRGRPAPSRRSRRSARTTIASTSLCSITAWSSGPRESALSGTVTPAAHLRAVEGGQELGLVAQQQADVRARLRRDRASSACADPADARAMLRRR